MMKKLLCCLLLMLLAVLPAQADTYVSIGLHAYTLRPLEDGRVQLDLLLDKEGESCYDLQEVLVTLYDDQGRAIEAETQEMVVFPLQDIPAGAHYVPITLVMTLPEGAEAADFSIDGIVGTAKEESRLEELDVTAGYIGGWDGGLTMTAWLPLDAAEGEYLASVIAVDAEGNFLGNAQLLPEQGCVIPGERMMEAVCAACGLPEETVSQMGIAFDGPAYALFSDVPLPYLTDIPNSFVIIGYRVQPETPAAPLVSVFDSIEMQPDGSFVITGCLKAEAEGLWQLNDIAGVTLQDVSGRETQAIEWTYDVPYCVVAHEDWLPYVIEGRAEAGFVPVKFRTAMSVAEADAADHHIVAGGELTLSSGTDGGMTLRCTMPAQENVDPADCYVCVFFLDLENDVYRGASWTYPGEAWLQDGEIRLPDMDAPEGVGTGTAMVTMYCVADGTHLE